MYSAWVIQRVCGGTSLPWNGGGWRRRDYLARDSASPRWPERWACIGSQSAAGRVSLSNREGGVCARLSILGVHPSSARPSCGTSRVRSSVDPRRSDLLPDCGLPPGCAISSSTGAGCGTTRTTSGASCAGLSGVANGPAGGHWSAMRRRSGAGRSIAGCRLKKSPPRAAYHHLRRRERTERAAPPGAHLGATRADSGAAVSLQLEGYIGRRRNHLVELLLPPLSQDDPQRSGDRLPRPFVAPSAGRAVGAVGRAAGAPGARGERIHSCPARPARHRVAAELRTGTQSGRVHLGLLEASRFTQLLPARFRSAQPPGLPSPTPHAPTSAPHPSLLAPSCTVTIIYRTQ